MRLQHTSTGMIPDGGEPVLYLNPRATQITSLIEEVTAMTDQPAVQLLAEREELNDACTDFMTAAKMADLIEQGQLKLQTLTTPVENTLIVTESDTVVPITDGHQLSTSEQEFSTALYGDVRSQFEAAERYQLRTPALSTVKETLREDIGDDIADEFEKVLSTADEISNTVDYLNVVEVLLLLAARNRVLLYDISKWGEDVGVASKATFSRTKSALEEADLIETEKVPIDIGRPRLRLIAPPRVTNADLTTLPSDIPSQM